MLGNWPLVWWWSFVFSRHGPSLWAHLSGGSSPSIVDSLDETHGYRSFDRTRFILTVEITKESVVGEQTTTELKEERCRGRYSSVSGGHPQMISHFVVEQVGCSFGA